MTELIPKLRALSVHQPDAEAIIRGTKTAEGRSRRTTFRGRFYVYATQQVWDEEDEGYLPGELPHGVIIGTVELVDCVRGGDYDSIGYGWILRNPERLPTPLKPETHPQSVWFHPFGRPEGDATDDLEELELAANGSHVDDDVDDNHAEATSIRFSPVLAANNGLAYTPYHSRYFALQLVRRSGANQPDKLAQSLSNAKVALNPHQVDAALFAFRSPLARGAILADEVGLGKTIEAGIVLSQLWAERKRRILIIVPASLRKQWSNELAEKFFIPSQILETKSYREFTKAGESPFLRPQQVVICSYEYARSKSKDIAAVPWDLVILDEAHRLRNVYKKGAKISRSLQAATKSRPKLLLTATPLQNTLMELYGLVSFVDEHIFGSAESFRELFMRKDSASPGVLANLRARLATVCQRTLRKQVLQYIRYTKRFAITQDFTPTRAEQEVYDQISTFLQRKQLHSLPTGQRTLIELLMRKILASSTYAISGTLRSMVDRLRQMEKSQLAATEGSVVETIGDDVEVAEEIAEEWDDDDDADVSIPRHDSGLPISTPIPTDIIGSIRAEASELENYLALAESITHNAKGDALLTALRQGFALAADLGALPKALIFTESRRTQTYLCKLLEENGYHDQIVLFNGTNSDAGSKRVYQDWLKRHSGTGVVSGSPSADIRAALVEEFAERKSIMIATEAAAEGVNLQFCSLVVNFDLPWNPQRIEQRIGRCHRYGQKYDVIVVNFLNSSNAADKRIYELLNLKFHLFNGVFGASDEILGAIGSGVDFERRINEILREARTPDEIQSSFDELQQQLEGAIQATLQETRSKLMENFDEEVREKLRLTQDETDRRLDRYSDWLWALTATELRDTAAFDHANHRFWLREPATEEGSSVALSGGYYLPHQTRGLSDAELAAETPFRSGHPLAETLLERALQRDLSVQELVVDYERRGGRVSLVERLRGMAGWMTLELLTVTSLDEQDALLFAGVADDGTTLSRETCEKLMAFPATVGAAIEIDPMSRDKVNQLLAQQVTGITSEDRLRNEQFFESESDKLDLWADDLKENLERELKNLDLEIREAKREKRAVADLQGKLAAQKKVNELERTRNHKKRSLMEAQDQIEAQKEVLISEVEARLEQQFSRKHVFTIRWRVV